MAALSGEENEKNSAVDMKSAAIVPSMIFLFDGMVCLLLIEFIYKIDLVTNDQSVAVVLGGSREVVGILGQDSLFLL